MRQGATGVISVFYRIIITGILLFGGALYAQSPVASFTMSSAQGCKPLNVQFTSTSTNATGYSWNFGNGNTSSQQNPSNIFTTPGNFMVTLTVTGPGGTNSTSHNINVVPQPVADFTATQLVACQGYGIIQFQNSSVNFDSCVWDFGDGTKSYLNNPSHIYSIAGVFTVNVIVYNKSFGCSDFKTRTSYITINPQPAATITIDTLATCDINHVFNFSAQPANSVSSYTWNFGDATTSSLQNISHTYTASGTYPVTLLLQNNFGCSDTLAPVSSVKVLSNPVPVISSSSPTGCTPLTVNYGCNATTAASWQWIFGNGDSAYIRNPSCLYDSAGVFNGSLNVVYPNGCKQNVTINTVTVDQSPIPGFIMTNYVGCAPLTVTFTNKSNTGNFTWYWDFGDGTTSNSFNAVHVYDSIGYFVPSLVATSPNGCTNIAHNNWYYVNVNGPTASFHPDVTSGCLPLTVNFTNTSVNAVSWQWDFGDGGTSTVQHPTYIYNNQGNYTVRLVVKNTQGCSDTLYYPTKINTVNTAINFVPPAPITACVPHTVNLADNSAATSWLWDFGDGTTSILANPAHTYSTVGTFTVSLTTWMANEGCSNHISNFQTFIIDGSSPGFTYTVSSCPPYIISFTDTSKNSVSWQWNFGDGGSSSLQNPTHVFNGPGSYDVSLTTTTPNGCAVTLQTSGGVDFTGLGSHATVITTDSVPPIDVLFHANSTDATWFKWSFGDGDSAFVSDPAHTFAGLGPYNISLTVGNDSCHYTFNYPPVTFGGGGKDTTSLGGEVITPEVVEYHCAPYTVNFNNPVTDALSVKWDFGDGETSADFSPIHMFTKSGNYTATLIATTAGGAIDTIHFSEVYYIVKPPTDFNISTLNTCSGVIVNVSTGIPSSSSHWNFGSGHTSNSNNASYTYPNVNASYVISLDVTDTNTCSSFIAKAFTINTNNPISASKKRGCAGDSVSFSVGNMNYASYLWNFGDGNSSSVRNPTHAYADSGLYTVTLAATDINNCVTNFTLSYQIEIFDPEPAFTYSTPLSNCTYVFIAFTNQSSGSDSWQWNFGDGQTATTKDVIHYYTIPGYHDVTLTAYKNVCSKAITIPNLVYASSLTPDFTYSSSGNCVPSTVEFTDLSIDAVKWVWDFGDGDSSMIQNPVHVYLIPPKGPITLTVTDINGCKKSISKAGLNATMAAFAISDSSGCNPFTVAFADSSINAISWLWNFGDGDTSTQTNPTHSYTSDGYFNVRLIVGASSGCFDTLQIDSLISVGTAIADFNADSTSGCVPFIVNFTDHSQTTDKWLWDFGDGSTSANQNPSHVYVTPGLYTVKLIAGNNFGCSDTLVKTEMIRVRGSSPDFTPSVTNGCSALFVQFTDASQGAVGWDWNFGDGTTATGLNPTHTYSDSGAYTVSLYTLDSTGCSTIFTYPVPITVSWASHAMLATNDTVGCAPYTVNLDTAGTTADTIVWIMGDGNIITGANPSYTYQNSGIYYIELIAKNNQGCADTFKLPSPIVVNMQPQAGFVSDKTQGCIPTDVQFNDVSSMLDNPVYHWDFGNGDTSDLKDPLYTYTTSGTFTVTLTVTNRGGCSSTYSWNDLIVIFDQIPPPATDLYRVTVNDDHEVELNWHLCRLRDMNYYVIYKFNNSINDFDSIAQIYQNTIPANANIPVYKDYNVNTLTNTYQYKVLAVDVCNNRLPLSALRAHETMDVESTAGNMKVNVNWTPYSGCDFNSYEIYRQDNLAGPFQKVGAVDTSQNQFSDTTAWCPIPYRYKVKALSICEVSDMDSWSDSTGAEPTSDVSKQYIEVVRSTVVDNKFVLTEWKPPVLFPYMVDRYNIYRSIDKIHYTFIASVPAMMTQFSDYEADVQHQEYYYKIEIQNVCSIATQPGNINSSILLNVESTEVTHTLKWTKYFDWDKGVDTYVIEKQDLNGNWQPVRTVSGNTTEWEEE